MNPTNCPYEKILIIGSGPIVIGQACEFDYSGTQACKALTELGVEVVLVNSNPATIMTDPDVASKVYVEPLKKKYLTKILEKEKPDAVIPTLGGQTALNLALELYDDGIFERLNIKMLGANPRIIQRAEDREEFNEVLEIVGAQKAESTLVNSFEKGLQDVAALDFPVILRPNYTLGGGGGGVAYSFEEYKEKLANALLESPTSEVLVEQSLLGWSEYELEVMRDQNGTFVVICSIENIDPCGVHTGDSITVAPQQTLSDREYQEMRDEAQKIVNEVGVETGGANIQFAVHPHTRQRLVIEMNPRVSRSSALASKATGFPIAKIAVLLAVGISLEEIENDITKTTPSCYEPALDYVVTKIPRFAFEKFPGSKDVLTTQMKSVGEAMGIGRTFKESFNKAYISLEKGHICEQYVDYAKEKVSYPNSERMKYLFEAFRRGHSVEELNEWTGIHEWFLEQFKQVTDFELDLAKSKKLNEESLWQAKRLGFTDSVLAKICESTQSDVKGLRENWNIKPGFLQVDTCAGEFASETPYFYSTYWSQANLNKNLFALKDQKRVLIVGSGPNRIGQGIEFDYGCVRSVKALRNLGYEVIMVNSNPETVSTDYDTSDFLFFEPLDAENVSEVCEVIQAEGVICQLGGQTSIQLAPDLVKNGFKILGSDIATIDRAEDRAQFIDIVRSCNAKVPPSGMAGDINQALKIANEIDYPIMVRPSYVLGGRRMEIVETEVELKDYFIRYKKDIDAEHPCLMDHFLEQALEIDVDLVRGKDWTLVGGVIEHIEAAGVHSGDSMGVLPPQRLKTETLAKIEKISVDIANKLGIIGFLNLQLAVKDDNIFVIEANPRSSRTVPFVAKATRVPLTDIAMRAILDIPLQHEYDWKNLDKVAVKGVSFPFKKFPNADSILGPEMKSTGESMGRGATYSEALMKALVSVGLIFPKKGEVFLSLRDKDKEELLPAAQTLVKMGFSLSATGGTADFLNAKGLECLKVKKVHEGRPHCVDRIRSGEVSLVINTTSGKQAIETSFSIRRSCIDYSIPCLTESDAAQAFLLALENQKGGSFDVYPLEKGLKA